MKYLKAIPILLILLSPATLKAQAPGGGDLDGDPGVPIDGGMTILASAALAYGAAMLKKKVDRDKLS